MTSEAVAEEDVVVSEEAVEDLAVAQEEADVEEVPRVATEGAKAATKITLASMRTSFSTGTRQVSRISVSSYLNPSKMRLFRL